MEHPPPIQAALSDPEPQGHWPVARNPPSTLVATPSDANTPVSRVSGRANISAVPSSLTRASAKPVVEPMKATQAAEASAAPSSSLTRAAMIGLTSNPPIRSAMYMR